jgi:predicted phosphodiesterase
MNVMTAAMTAKGAPPTMTRTPKPRPEIRDARAHGGVLILSDIHSNWEALRAVLDDAANRYERVCCLGDIVGYGADPNAVTEWVRANAEATVRGNHDRACTGSSARNFNPAAKVAVYWTRQVLSADNLDYLRRLPRGPVTVPGTGVRHFELVHGSPENEDRYLHTPADAGCRSDLQTRITFFGHTHDQGGFMLARRGTSSIVPSGTLELEPDAFYLINPGSVGQPRDGDPRASYAIYTPAARAIEYRRAAYDMEAAARKIVAAGLPPMLAERLFEGY